MLFRADEDAVGILLGGGMDVFAISTSGVGMPWIGGESLDGCIDEEEVRRKKGMDDGVRRLPPLDPDPPDPELWLSRGILEGGESHVDPPTGVRLVLDRLSGRPVV